MLSNEERIARAKEQAKLLASQLKLVSDRLRRLVERDVSFITADAQVLREHPELSSSAKTQAQLDEAMRTLDNLSEAWWQLAEDAAAAHRACCEALPGNLRHANAH